MRIILGAGAKVNQTCDVYNIWPEIKQFYEKPRILDETKRGIPVIDSIIEPQIEYLVHTMVGDCRDKRRLAEVFTSDAKENDVKYLWGNLFHHTDVFTNPKSIGVDVTIRPLSIICSNVVLGNHVDIGNLSNIGHDCIIGDYSIIAGGVAMSGHVTLGEGVFIGVGASIKPDRCIGEGAVIGAGAVVTKDVPNDTVVAGNPARSDEKFKKVSPWTQLF